MGFLVGASLYSDDFLITDGVLSYTRYDHQSTALMTEFWYWLFPDSKAAGGVVAAPIKDPFLLLRLAFNKLALTHWTERAGFIYKRATIPALGKT